MGPRSLLLFPMLRTERMDDTLITVCKYTDFDEMKADEYRYWQSVPRTALTVIPEADSNMTPCEHRDTITRVPYVALRIGSSEHWSRC